MTSHAALTASPRLSATIANETAPNRAIAVHKTFVCHAELLLKIAPIDSSRTAAGLFWNHFSNRPTERAIQIRVTISRHAGASRGTELQVSGVEGRTRVSAICYSAPQ